MSKGSERVKLWRLRNPDRARDAQAVTNARRGGYEPPVNASEIVRNDRPMVFAGYVVSRQRSSIAITTTAPGHFGDGFVSAALALSETSGRSGYPRLGIFFPTTCHGSEIAV